MLLNIGYRIPVKKLRVSSEAEKSLVAARKKEIQDRFKSELGLKVDEPKQGPTMEIQHAELFKKRKSSLTFVAWT